MFLDDDLDPRKPVKKPKDLSGFSVSELDDYMAALRAEIDRAQAEKTRKTAHLAAASGLFKSGKGD